MCFRKGGDERKEKKRKVSHANARPLLPVCHLSFPIIQPPTPPPWSPPSHVRLSLSLSLSLFLSISIFWRSEHSRRWSERNGKDRSVNTITTTAKFHCYVPLDVRFVFLVYLFVYFLLFRLSSSSSWKCLTNSFVCFIWFHPVDELLNNCPIIKKMNLTKERWHFCSRPPLQRVVPFDTIQFRFGWWEFSFVDGNIKRIERNGRRRYSRSSQVSNNDINLCVPFFSVFLLTMMFQLFLYFLSFNFPPTARRPPFFLNKRTWRRKEKKKYVSWGADPDKGGCV